MLRFRKLTTTKFQFGLFQASHTEKKTDYNLGPLTDPEVRGQHEE